ncbi:MAG: hypothetical protein HQL18_03295 [Candidatus Omnitrophica bacterium]|nr:hypothetical protein [Candidatus Omnitrophota bacterium]
MSWRTSLLLAGILLSAQCCVAVAETLTLTTYYPAPAGAYKSLRTHNMCVGASCTSKTVTDENLEVKGDIYVDHGAARTKGAGYREAVTFTRLHDFHQGVPFTAPDDSICLTGLPLIISACDRYCSSGCSLTDEGCSTPIAGLGYHGGTAVQCDIPAQKVTCVCS